jgi:hypothetical protein
VASSNIIGIAQSMQVTSIPSMLSRGLPVGKSLPVRAPAASINVKAIGAALPGTPSIEASPK